MFPALPTGMQIMSGESPKESEISKDAVFCPSKRYGFSELTNSIPSSVARSRTMVNASSKLPSTAMMRAPYAIACASLPNAISPDGTNTKACRL